MGMVIHSETIYGASLVKKMEILSFCPLFLHFCSRQDATHDPEDPFDPFRK